MIPHWKRSLFATLQAFHVQQLCTSKEKEPSEKKGDSFPSCTFFFFICLLLLYLFSFALNPLPFSQLAALKRKQTKPKNTWTFFQLLPVSKALQLAKQSREKRY
jgi:quinol-cytochrome oxidoreductase complex cytochrome b subunit